MTYMVVKKGRLHEHADNRDAAAEARRLTEKEGTPFYVVEAKMVTKVTLHVEAMPVIVPPKIGMRHAALLNRLFDAPNQAGRPWTKDMDELLGSMWMTGDYTLHGIAKIFKRTAYAIECRLDRLGYPL